jgi:two-component system sensor histidine kinase DesK
MTAAGCDPPPALRRGLGSPLALGSIWLPFLIFPVLALAHSHVSPLHEAVAFAAAAAFVAIYCALLAGPFPLQPGRAALLPAAVLIVLAVGLTVLDRNDWASLFIYASATGAVVLELRLARLYVIFSTTLAGTLTALGNAGSSAVLSVAVGSAGIGFLLISLCELRDRNAELLRARNELAELAVAGERERFARDLHDLLGHSLSVISLKAQLSRRLLASDPDAAAAHLSDLEQVTRDALGEVRDAVSGYRQPTLEAALAAARQALAAASIDAHIEVAETTELEPATERVLAWAVREGTTNVIRHSGSSNCWIRLGGGVSTAALEIVDDGTATAGRSSGGGSGLRGLRERAASLAGAVENGARSEGGYRLAVILPRGAR